MAIHTDYPNIIFKDHLGRFTRCHLCRSDSESLQLANDCLAYRPVETTEYACDKCGISRPWFYYYKLGKAEGK